MSFIFTNSAVKNTMTSRQRGEVLFARGLFENAQKNNRNMAMNSLSMAVNYGLSQDQLVANASAVIPQDVYREMDSQAVDVFRANNQTLLNDLMPLAKSLPVGKILHKYRQVSDSGLVNSSIGGQVPAGLDKAVYTYDDAIVVIHSAGYGREWREWQAQQSEGFDGLLDDNKNTTRAVMDTVVGHIYDGVSVEFQGTEAYGIKNSANTQVVDIGASGLNIDFTSSSATAEGIRNAFTSILYTLRTTNNIVADVTFYISREIEQNLQRWYSTSDIQFGTILENLKRLAGVADIKTDAQLSGNELVGVVLNDMYIRPLVGMAMSTVPIIRQQPFDNYNFLVWTATGLEIRADATGKSGVLYAYEAS